MLKLLTNYNKL